MAELDARNCTACRYQKAGDEDRLQYLPPHSPRKIANGLIQQPYQYVHGPTQTINAIYNTHSSDMYIHLNI